MGANADHPVEAQESPREAAAIASSPATIAAQDAPAMLGDLLALGGDRAQSTVVSMQRRVGNRVTTRWLDAQIGPGGSALPVLGRSPVRPGIAREPAAEASSTEHDLEPTAAELEEAAGALGVPTSDPRVAAEVRKAKLDLLLRRPPAQETVVREKRAAATPRDPSDPHTWTKAPDETMEQFLERQRKGLLDKELKSLGLTEAQLRDQVTRTGTRTEEHVRLGDVDWVTIRQAIPTPGGGVRVITTIEGRGKGQTKRSRRAWDAATGEQATETSVIEDGEERITSRTGDQALFAQPGAPGAAPPASPAAGASPGGTPPGPASSSAVSEPSPPPPAVAPPPDPSAAAKKLTPHTRWTRLPGGRVLVEEIDAEGKVVPGSGHTTDAFQSPQDRIKADQARDPNAVWHP